MQFRRTALPIAATTAALGIVALSAGAASAHVTVTPSTTAAGSYAVLTFSVGHGCEGSPTTKLAIQLPEEIPAVTPTINPGWTIEKVVEKLDEPVQDAHGNELTERVSQVVYTAKTPLEDGYRDTVALQVQLPDAAGKTLAFPVVQSCVEGQTGWTELAAEGQDAEELASPAPVLTITEASADGHGHSDDTDDAEGSDASGDESGDADAAAEDNDDSAQGLAIGGLVAGIGGLALGGVALARSGRRA
ncbi:YcnI family protein [Nocardioides caeni]|uniref:DUF1775 domain-containing protein n=1 Tax=Nocardioides caeni TaxID=574700 RepID=A0A4S8NLI2_9ACTN|nr:YcnI family protein [Nocardioides caeni]THV17850.1 DUF1775 domain-containing protein [Nocardioides caeni]